MVDISKLSLIELKALVYDEVAKLEQAQKNIQALNFEIQKKMNEKQPEKK